MDKNMSCYCRYIDLISFAIYRPDNWRPHLLEAPAAAIVAKARNARQSCNTQNDKEEIAVTTTAVCTRRAIRNLASKLCAASNEKCGVNTSLREALIRMSGTSGNS
jgi:hypothetical protein